MTVSQQREQAIDVVQDLYRNAISLLTALGGIDDANNGHALDSDANGSVRQISSLAVLDQIANDSAQWVGRLLSDAESTLQCLDRSRTTEKEAGSIVALEGETVDPLGKRWFPYWSVAA